MNSEFWNAIQAASNQAAGIVSGPVDIASWLLRKAGAPVPENALLSSKWMEEQGLMKSVKPGVGQMVGDTLGLLAPIAAAAKAPQIAAAAIKGGENLAAPRTLGTQRGIFMGDLSKTWDKAAADKARQMEKAGVDAKKIWEDTGTFKGADGKWRQEIDDSAARLVPSAVQDLRFNPSRTQKQILSHDPLYRAYPDAAKIFTYGTNGVEGGGYASGVMGKTDAIELGLPSRGTANLDDLRSFNLHELQHAIQGREKFASGGNASEFVESSGTISGTKLNPEAQAIFDSGLWDGMPKMGAEELAFRQQAAIQEAYKRLAGEAEARAVQARMNLTAEQRRALFPLDSYDVPVDQLIVRQGSGPQMSILERNGQGLLNDPPKPPALLGQAKPTTPDVYGGLHRPPMSDSGAPLHDLTGGGLVYPDDVYSSNAARYYGAGNPQDDAALFAKIHAFKGKPDAMVDIFRAVPKEAFVGGKQPPFNHGDWVTISRKYAVEHGEGALNGDYKIMRARVPAKSLFTNGDSPYEFGLDRIAGGIER